MSLESRKISSYLKSLSEEERKKLLDRILNDEFEEDDLLDEDDEDEDEYEYEDDQDDDNLKKFFLQDLLYDEMDKKRNNKIKNMYGLNDEEIELIEKDYYDIEDFSEEEIEDDDYYDID